MGRWAQAARRGGGTNYWDRFGGNPTSFEWAATIVLHWTQLEPPVSWLWGLWYYDAGWVPAANGEVVAPATTAVTAVPPEADRLYRFSIYAWDGHEVGPMSAFLEGTAPG